MSQEKRPLLIYDGDCGFCRFWVERWKRLTGSAVRYEPYQEAASRLTSIPAERFQQAVQLVEKEGVSEGAEAVFRLLAFAPRWGWPLQLYRMVPGFRQVSEAVYRFVASHRGAFFRLNRLLLGPDPEPPSYRASGRIFVKLLALAYLMAFVSLAVQVTGLIGGEGILPAADLLGALRQRLGIERYWLLPTVFWLGASDAVLKAGCWAGAALSVLLLIDAVPALAAFLLWALYLSFVTVGRDFLSFQWDNLLLEAGFLAVFLVPWRLRTPRAWAPGSGAVWLLRWLLFRLMFSSGAVKLLSGDPAWRSLTALQVHYETQPLPTWAGWYAHQLPAWFQTLSALAMFAVELLVPFLIFMPLRARRLAALLLIGFQCLIALTGNYCFFNWLTVALCVLLVDDAWLSRLPSVLRPAPPAESGAAPEPRAKTWVFGFAAAGVLFLSGIQMAGLVLWSRWGMPGPAAWALRAASPLRTVNTYGLFAVMTTTRPEIVVEGSNDGADWKEYTFRWKPGDLKGRPRFVAPHQPRVDWQMWFAALGSAEENWWFKSFVVRLLQGNTEVLGLLASDPFLGTPPRFIRAVLYEYRFTTWEESRTSGNWWKRELKGLYLPPASLRR